MRRKAEPIDMSEIKRIKDLRDNIYCRTEENQIMIVNDYPKDEGIVKRIKKNSIVINREVPNR